jgi:hypothetical protein
LEISPNFSVLPICPKIQDTHFINNRETKGKTKTVTKAADRTKELTPKNADMHGTTEEGKPKHGGKEANHGVVQI